MADINAIEIKEKMIKDLTYAVVREINADTAQANLIEGIIQDAFIDYSVFKICHTELALTDDEEFRELCGYYIMKKTVRGIRKSTIYTVLDEVMRLRDYIKKRIPEITSDDIDTYIVHLKRTKNYASATLRGRQSYISSFFTLLYKNRKIPKNPMAAVEPIKVELTYEKALTKTELTKLENACKTYKEKAVLAVFLETGVRLSECSNLNIEDVDFAQKEIFVHLGKGGKDRIVPIGDKALHYLQLYLTKERPDISVTGTIPPNTPLWMSTNPRYGRMKADQIASIIYSLKARSGVSRVHPHLLRKTYATTLYKRGVEIIDIAKLLGHASFDSLPRYVVMESGDVKLALHNMLC